MVGDGKTFPNSFEIEQIAIIYSLFIRYKEEQKEMLMSLFSTRILSFHIIMTFG